MMGIPCSKHDKPIFGCLKCIEAARSVFKITMAGEYRQGRPKFDRQVEKWTCPQCKRQHAYTKMVCLGGVTAVQAGMSLHPEVLCGYDRRTGDVPDRLLRMVERSKGG